MGNDTLGLIFTAIGCSAGATWLIRSSLAGIEKALDAHVAEDKAVHAEVIDLKKAQQKRGRR